MTFFKNCYRYIHHCKPRSQRRSVFISVLCSLVLLPLLTALQGCNTVIEKQPMPSFTSDARWAYTPLLNLTEVPHAGKRVTAILNTHFNSKGLNDLKKFPLKTNKKHFMSVNDKESSLDKNSIRWAKKQKIAYLVTGTVDEWRYKYGLHGEPTVGVSLKIIDVKTAKILWSASGAKTGRSNQNLAGITNQLISNMMKEFPQNL